MRSHLKTILIYSIGIILLLTSLLLVSYPFISNYLMGLNQSGEVEAYEQDMTNIDDTKISNARKEAEEYNKSLFGNAVITDPFDPNAEQEKDYEYEKLLNLNNNSIIATLEIPVIDINLPVYHGTSDEVLQKGVGHLQRTSLPIGGTGTHAVLTGHTGLSSASLFTDINLLKEGDAFYIHCLNETLAYEVDQIKVVKPNETDELSIDPTKDYVTLITCTPYGINSHRLLVRGTRIPYVPNDEVIAAGLSRTDESTWMIEYKKALKVGAVVFALVIIIYVIINVTIKKRRKKISGNASA